MVLVSVNTLHTLIPKGSNIYRRPMLLLLLLMVWSYMLWVLLFLVKESNVSTHARFAMQGFPLHKHLEVTWVPTAKKQRRTMWRMVHLLLQVIIRAMFPVPPKSTRTTKLQICIPKTDYAWFYILQWRESMWVRGIIPILGVVDINFHKLLFL